MSEEPAKDLGPLLGLLAHDLRNPVATLLANLSFLETATVEPSLEAREALADSVIAVRELMAGIDHLGWLSRSLSGLPVLTCADADVIGALAAFRARHPTADVELSKEPLRARGATLLVRVLELLDANAAQHAPCKSIRVRAARRREQVVVTVTDDGPPVDASLRELAFTLVGQEQLKGRADGRYGRLLGLFAVRLLVDAMGATVAAEEHDGRAAFVITLAAA